MLWQEGGSIMKKTKIWLILATIFIVVGIIAFMGVMSMFNWDFTKLSTTKYEENSYEITENFKNISIVSDTSDISFLPAEKCTVQCFEQKNVKYIVEVKDDTLTIKIQDTRKWYEHIGINFQNTKLTVMLPQEEYDKLSIKSETGKVNISEKFTFDSIDITASTGDVLLEKVSSENIDVSVSTGKVQVSNIECGDIKINVSTGKTEITNTKCNNIESKGSTGAVELKNVIATENISVKRSTGDVKFEKSDAKEIFVETATGAVTGTLLSEKVFIAETSTGRMDVPKTTTGGRCEITTSTGDIRIKIEQ